MHGCFPNLHQAMQALAATRCGAVSCAISRFLSAAFCILHLGKDVDRSRMDAASELAWEASLVRLNCLFNAHRSEQTGISCEFYSGFAAFTGPMCSRQVRSDAEVRPLARFGCGLAPFADSRDLRNSVWVAQNSFLGRRLV